MINIFINTVNNRPHKFSISFRRIGIIPCHFVHFSKFFNMRIYGFSKFKCVNSNDKSDSRKNDGNKSEKFKNICNVKIFNNCKLSRDYKSRNPEIGFDNGVLILRHFQKIEFMAIKSKVKKFFNGIFISICIHK